MLTVIVADADASFAEALRSHLAGQAGLRVQVVAKPAEAMKRARTGDVDLLFLAAEGEGAFDVLGELKRLRSETHVVLTATASRIEDAVRAMKLGAADYLVKPLKPEQVAVTVERVRQARAAAGQAPAPARTRLVGMTPGMVRLNEQIERASPDLPVLLVGAPGTEKEPAARTLHKSGPFVTVDGRAGREADFESRFAASLRSADGGTIFVDDVGELPPTSQGTLARAIVERVVRAGSTEEGVRVRVIAGTSANLLESVGRGLFRSDLLERLAAQTLAIPPLRERMDDVALLVDAQLRRRAAEGRRTPRSLSAEALATLMGHDWPGNVAELAQAVERACELGEGDLLERRHLPPSVVLAAEARRGTGASNVTTRSLREMESEVIRKLLTEHRGDTEVVSNLLQIDRSTLYRKIKRYDIDLDGFKGA